MSHPDQTDGESPFDSIKREADDGREYWSARELQPLMGYDKWERFEGVIERAIRSSENTGTFSDAAFSRIREPVTTSGNAPDTERVDYHVSRYAAYLIAMNGEPSKPAVAAAQSYFAIRTREAEAATSKPMDELEMARKYVAVLERQREQEKELEVARPKATKWDQYCDADGLIGMSDLASILGTNVQTMTSWLVEINLFRKQTSKSGGNRNLPRDAGQHAGWFEVKLEVANGVQFPVAYATPRGVDVVIDFWGRRTAGS